MEKRKAYLVKLEGMGDHRWYLLNEEDWKHLDACCEWDRFGDEPAPVPPDALVDRVMAADGCDSTREEVVYYLTPDKVSSTGDNDVALSMPASDFDGETFDIWEASVKAVNAFCKKHGLEIMDEYEGAMY